MRDIWNVGTVHCLHIVEQTWCGSYEVSVYTKSTPIFHFTNMPIIIEKVISESNFVNTQTKVCVVIN